MSSVLFLCGDLNLDQMQKYVLETFRGLQLGFLMNIGIDDEIPDTTRKTFYSDRSERITFHERVLLTQPQI